MHAIELGLWIAVGLINVAPLVGAFSTQRLRALYGLDDLSDELTILLQHRAVLFGIVGGLLLISAFVPSLRSVAGIAASISMASFLVIAMRAGSSSAPIRKVVRADVAGLFLLGLAVGLDWVS